MNGKPTRGVLLIIIAILTFPFSLFIYLGLKLYEGSNYKVAQRRAFAKIVNGIAGGEAVRVPECNSYGRNARPNYNKNGNYNNSDGNNDDSESYGKERERSVGSFLKMLEKLDSYKVFNSFYLIADNGSYQEIDHIVVGKTGIFHIETKAYKGDVTIGTDGSWSRTRYGQLERLYNPASQIDMHELLIKNVLGTKYPVNSIINVATELEETNLTGKENCRYPIVHYKDLQSYIMTYNSGTTLTDEEIKAIGYQIHTHLSNEKPKS